MIYNAVAIMGENKHPIIIVDIIEKKYCLMYIMSNIRIFLNLIPKRHIKNKITIFDNIIKAEVIRQS